MIGRTLVKESLQLPIGLIGCRMSSSPSLVQTGEMPFAKAKLGNFVQEAPQLHNPYDEDSLLRSYLKRVIVDEKVHSKVSLDLHRFADRIVDEIDGLGRECELNPPRLEPFTAWGNRVDHLVTCSAWKRLKDVSAEEGLIAIGYDEEFGPWRRLYQYAKLYLFEPSAGLYGCPLAMTDGAAKVIKELNLYADTGEAFARLTSRDPDKFWTSGQWMTEKRGGSDVGSSTETIAVPQSDGSYALYGYKWFSSAIDAEMTLTLARVSDEGEGGVVEGSKGLSMFFLKTRNEQSGDLNGIQMIRLKDKLGTRQVPTAELLLDGAIAHKVSPHGRGVVAISHMLNTTRLHNAVSSVADMRKILNLARDYMHRRVAFGRKLVDHPLHVHTLSKMEAETRGCTLMVLETARLLGLSEVGLTSENDNMLLRLLLPLIKLYTAKQAVAVVSEGLESFGGAGYLEDTGLPSLLRDAQVLPIWEGTTNVLCMDVLRHLSKSGTGAVAAFQTAVAQNVKPGADNPSLKESCQRILTAQDAVIAFASSHSDLLSLAARDFAYSLARIIGGSMLVEHAALGGFQTADVHAALRWCADQPLSFLQAPSFYETSISSDRALLGVNEAPSTKSML